MADLPASAPAREIPFRGGGFVLSPRRGAAILAFAFVLALWEAASRAGWISEIFLPSPGSVLTALQELIVSGILWTHIGVSLGRLLVGWTVGTGCGLAAGLAIGIWSLSRAIGLPVVSALFPIPKIALLPLLILWLGIGESSKVATIALGVFFPTTIAMFSAIDAVPRNLIRMAQSFNIPMRSIVWKVMLPSALPGILAGFRISVSTALILVVAAEMIGAQYGIGAFLLTAGNLMQSDDLMAGVVILSLLGLSIGAVLTVLERMLLRWR